LTLRRKLLLWYSGVFFLTACGLAFGMYALVAHKLRGDFFQHLTDEYEEALRISAEHANEPEALRTAIEIEAGGNAYFPMSYRLYDAGAGTEVFTYAPRWAEALPTVPRWRQGGGAPVRSLLRLGDRPSRCVYLLTGPVSAEDRPGLVVEVGLSHRRLYKRLRAVRQILLGSLFASVLAAVAGGWFLAARSLNPIDRITASLERVQAEDLSARLDEGPADDEIARLTHAVNGLLQRLERAFGGLRAFTADAAHELRTPLSALRCALEVGGEGGPDDQARAELLGKVDELTRLVNDLLLLASLDAETYAEEEQEVDLGVILEDVTHAFGVLADQKGLRFSADLGPDCLVRGRPGLLRRLFANLLDNAVSYTLQGGTVSVEARREGGVCRIAVTDTGIGMSPADAERVFERFYRADSSRSRRAGGLGLGLSLCRRIVDLAGGRICVTSREGEGSTFVVTLPRATPARA
jgi:signal transduction histidine kinase